ncbi:MAG: 4Fe-4S dicluster domain-containing protein [Bdellovibrionales bacterium]
MYEYQQGQLIINAPNCIDCKATDILGPRWSPKERGSGPSYKLM